MANAIALDLGTYRTSDGELVHLRYDPLGTLTAERDGPNGRVRIDPSVLTNAVKLSDDPFWPDDNVPVQGTLWEGS
jgi:hypothetical protein